MTTPLDTIETTYKRHTIRVHVHNDDDMGPPWEEHDGHGIVSDWKRHCLVDKAPGEMILCEDRGSVRFYDFQATMKKAKSEGWGLGEKETARLAARLGRQPTKGEILHASVMHDYEFLKGWCNDEWRWVGYVTEILGPDGSKLETEHDSCWGFESTDDGIKYMTGEARSIAEHAIDSHLKAKRKERKESQAMACRDIVTV